MFRGIILSVGLILAAVSCGDPAARQDADVSQRGVAVLETTEGPLMIALRWEEAPLHSRNFAQHCESGTFTGTAFHRIAPGYLVQGGDPLTRDDDPANDGFGGTPWDGVPLPGAEGPGGLFRGSVVTAPAGPESAFGSQFFILLTDEHGLDGPFVAFGEVIQGLETADLISNREGDAYPREYGGLKPRTPVRIEACRLGPTPEPPPEAEPETDLDGEDPAANQS